MKNLIIKSTLLLLITAAFFSCKKEDQDEPATEQTTTHDLGNGIVETVQRGPNGVNVVFSNWIQKTQPDWMIWDAGYKFTTDMITPSLTDAVKDKGIVLVYFNLSNYVAQLPNQSIGEHLVLDYHIETGKIIARYVYGGGSVYGNDFLTVKLRYVLIPNSAFGNTGTGKMSKPVDYSNYDEVCEYYSIPK